MAAVLGIPAGALAESELQLRDGLTSNGGGGAPISALRIMNLFLPRLGRVEVRPGDPCYAPKWPEIPDPGGILGAAAGEPFLLPGFPLAKALTPRPRADPGPGRNIKP